MGDVTFLQGEKEVTKNEAVQNLAMPWHAWVLGGVLLLYSLAAVYDHIMSLSQGENFYRASGMTAAQIEYFLNVPVWALTGWTLSVWGCFFGSIALLLRHRFAIGLFFISLVGSLIYIVYVLILSNGREAMGVLWFMPIVLATIIAGMIFYCRHLKRKSVLR